MYFSFVSNPIGTLNSDQAEKLRDFVDRKKSESPNVVVFEVRQPEEDGDYPITFVFPTDVSADVQAAMEAVFRTSENLQKLREGTCTHNVIHSKQFNYVGQNNVAMSGFTMQFQNLMWCARILS